MEPVHILVRIDRFKHLLGIDMLRQRQLHQNAVDCRIMVQLFNYREKICLACFRRKPMLDREHADFFRLLRLVGDIDF